MTVFALVNPEGEIGRRRDFGDTSPPTLAESKGRWLQVVTTNEAYDALSQVREGPAASVQGGVVIDAYTVRAKSADELEAMRQVKRAAISAQFLSLSSAPIAFTVGGAAKTWDADQDAIVNISGVVLMIAAGVSVPDPRAWTAHGELTPTNVSHAELVGLGAAIAARKDTLFVAKKTLEAALAGLATAAEIDAFDPLSGWA